MKKILIGISDLHDTCLKAMSKDRDISVSEIVRRAVDEYIESQAKKGGLINDYIKSIEKG
jgi:hypothetical protein